MQIDVITVGGGIAGSGLATVLGRKGKKVLVLERETTFKDRVRGENMLPWGAWIAKRLGLLDDLVAAGGHRPPLFKVYAMGEQKDARPFPGTTPHGEVSLNLYHPDLQEASLVAASKAGAEIKRGVNVREIAEKDGRWTVTYVENDKPHTISAPLVVGADGRFSKVREWGGFKVDRDPELLRIAGTVVEGCTVPDDGVYVCFGMGFMAFLAPLGKQRVRTYFVYPAKSGDRKLSGKEKIPEFLDAVRATNVPKEWFQNVTVTGPLAEFDGADQWVTGPAKRGLALIGDAAAATDPSWGCGLSKTMADIESLSSCLLETDDWDSALEKYKRTHDDYYGKLHRVLGCMTQLWWTPGPEADERRGRVEAAMKKDPTAFPDPAGMGPFGPCDEAACKRLLGLS
jgi:menaquinone-9 beta-reductase